MMERALKRCVHNSLPLIAVGLALLGCTRSPAPEPPPALGRVPVVMIVLDALSARHVGHLGYERPTTPAIDALAADGVTFAHAFAPAPYTLASIPSLFTGRLPDTHGLVGADSVLAEEETTLAEQLRAAGYRTWGAVNNLMGSSLFRLEQGFEVYYEMFRGEARERIHDPSPRGEELLLEGPEPFVAVVGEWLEQRDPAVPVFYYLHILEPHQPYEPPPEYRERFLPESYDGMFSEGFVATEQWPQAGSGRGPTEEDRQALRALYDANLAWADAQVGRILELMREDGLYDEALILITSDHGEAFWQHGRWGHSYQIYDEMLQVPLVVKLPAEAGPRGVRIETLAGLIDVVPTLCTWLDLPLPPAPLDGRSLAGVVAGSEKIPAERTLFLRTNHEVPTIGARTASAKTIVNHNRSRGPELEYYQVATDPEESENLASRESRRAAQQAEAVREWFKGATLRRRERGRELAPEEAKLLRKLGYVE